MNKVIRKLALLEKELIIKQELNRVQGYTTNPLEKELKTNITSLLDKIHTI